MCYDRVWHGPALSAPPVSQVEARPDSMEEGIRRRLPKPERVRAREERLLQRELQYALEQGRRKLSCPCRLCMRQQHSEKVPTSYRRCLVSDCRHPWFFGTPEVSYNPVYTKRASTVIDFAATDWVGNPMNCCSIDILGAYRATTQTTAIQSGTTTSTSTMEPRLGSD